MTVKEIYDYLNGVAPFSYQADFDNSGLLIGNPATEVTKIAVCLDITNEIISEAANLGANLIVSHHPVIFDALKNVRAGTPAYNLMANKISAICMHTNLDVVKGGISDLMVTLLDFSSSEVLTPTGENRGYGRVVTLDFSSDAPSLAELCKKVFNCSVVRYCDNDKVIKRIAVVSGSGGDELAAAAEKNCDAIITGDVKWSVIVEAKNRGIAVIDAGHFHTENIVCSYLVSILSTKFDVETFVPFCNADLCRYI